MSGLATCVKKEVSMKKENNALHKSTLTIREELSEKACSSVPTDPSEVPSAAEAVDTAQEALESGLESMPAEEKKPKRKKAAACLADFHRDDPGHHRRSASAVNITGDDSCTMIVSYIQKRREERKAKRAVNA